MAGKEDGDGQSLVLPEGTSKETFLNWVEALPDREPPSYLGLPDNAEKALLLGQGKKMVEQVKTIMEVLDEGEFEV